MPATPRRSRSFGGSAHHQRLLLANMAASLFAAEGITTTEGKAKALRPIAEKLITKAIKQRSWISLCTIGKILLSCSRARTETF